MSTPRHAEVAGAGIAGLAVATALAQRGWTVRVHERYPAVREVGAGIALGKNGVDALRELGALDEAVGDGQRISSWTVGDQWGGTLQEEKVAVDLYSARRESLQRSLLTTARAAGVEILTGSAVSGADSGALLTERGERFPADLVVGADGVGSRVRQSQQAAYGSRRVDLKVASLRFIIDRVDSDPVHEQPEWLSGNRRVGLLPLAGGKIAMYMFCPPGDTRGRALPIDTASWTASFPHLRSVFERLPAEGTWLHVRETRTRRWVSGSTVLLGDAAFSMAPNMGQGGCTALHAAVTLAEYVNRDLPITESLAAWEAYERPYVDYVQTWSRRYSRIVSQWPLPLLRLRSPLYRALSRSKRLASRFAGVDLKEATTVSP